MTDVSLREYFEALLVALDRRLDERWSNLEGRLGALNDLRAGVLTRDEYDAKHAQLGDAVERNRDAVQLLRDECVKQDRANLIEKQLQSLEIWRSNLMGRTVALGMIGAIIISVSTVLIDHLVTGA